jgi:hypothetical protein
VGSPPIASFYSKSTSVIAVITTNNIYLIIYLGREET